MTGGPQPSPPEATRLAAGLRELKQACGLSLAGLAARTTYSKSSWERYLNGKALPPRKAVTELCALANRSPLPLLALRDLADLHPAPPPKPPPSSIVPEPPEAAASRIPAAPKRPTHGTRRRLAVIVAGGLLAAGACVGLWPMDTHGSPAAHCHASSCEGQDPGSMLCARQPSTLLTKPAPGNRWIEVRYSRTCSSAWARISGAQVGDRVRITGPGRPPQTAQVKDALDAAGYVYTRMTLSLPGTTLRACLLPVHGSPACFTTTTQ